MVLKLTDEVESAPLLSLSDGSEPSHTPEFNDAQSAKLHVALGPQSPGLDVVSSAMSSGNAGDYRRLLADTEVLRQQEVRSDILSSILQADPSQITPEVIGVVQGLSNTEVQSPDLRGIIERKYAETYTNTAAASLENDLLEEAHAANPEATAALLDRTEVLSFKKNYAATALDEIQADRQEQSWAGTVFNVVENMVLGQYQTYDQVDDGQFVTAVMPGQNKEQQYAYLWGLDDPEEFKVTFDAAVEDLRSRNPYSAQQWVEGFFSYGGGEAFVDNVTAAADVAGVVPVTRLARALRGVVKGAARNPLKLHEIATDLGKNSDAAVGKIIDDIKGDTFFSQNIKNLPELGNSVASISDPNKLLKGAENLPRAAYNRMKEALLARSELAQKFLLEPNLVDRLVPEELVAYKDILLRDYVKQNPTIQKNVIDVEIADTADLGNVYNAKIVIGQRDGTLFESEFQAKMYFDSRIGGTKDYKVVQNGEGFQIEVYKTVDESKIGNDLKLGTSQRTPESLADSFSSLSYLRSPVSAVSKQQAQARSVAVTSKEMLDDLFSRLAEPFKKLSKGEVSELQDLMVDNRKTQKYFNDFGEFSQAFWDRFKKPPTEGQADTYFAYVQLNDLDLIVRDLDIYKQKARLGVERIAVKVDGNDVGFEGRIQDNLPYGDPTPFRVGVIENGKLTNVRWSGRIFDKDKKLYEKLQNEGYKIINATEPEFKIGEKFLDYVLVKDAKRSRIGVQNIGRKPGGHKVQKYPYYIKQGQISGDEGQMFYRGDKTFWNFRTEAEAKQFLDVLETARQKLLRQDPDAKKYVRDHIPIKSQEFYAAVAAKDINLQVPFAVTKAGSRTIDTGAYQAVQGLTDASRNSHKPSLLGRYLGERSEADLNTIRSEDGRLFEVEPAPYLSPLETLRSASADMISTRLMNDYTLMTRDNYLREFSDVLSGTAEEQANQGLAVLQNPTFKNGTGLEFAKKVQRAKNVSRAYNNLMNQGTELDNKVSLIKEKIVSSVMPKFGPRGQQWLEDRYLGQTADPGVFMRSAGFHMKMGFFNPVQYFKQANSLVNVVSIGGANGLRSGALYPVFRAAMVTNSEKVLAGLGKVANNVGLMKSDEFLESIALYKKSGFNKVGHDVGYLDDIRSPELVEGTGKKLGKAALKLGTTPFAEGERLARLAAWNTAYLERKSLLKGKKIGRADEAAILFRAKTLIGNMTREANAPWQKGYAAVVTQFFGYQARIMEQFLGKQLTGTEKARLFTGYAAIYGTPTALGAWAGVLPIREMLVDYMAEAGMDYENNPVAKVAVDGFANAMTNFIFDKDLNIAASYGPGGLPTFYDLWRQDKTIGDIMLGASGGIALQTFMDSAPFVRGMASEYMDFEGGIYNMTAQDFLQPLRNVSTADSAAKLYGVWNYNVWASKNGVDIMQMELPDAIIATMTGLQPQEIEKAFSQYRASKAGKEDFEAAQKDMIRQYRQAMKMEDGKTREAVIRDIKAQMILKGFTLREMAQTWKYAGDQEMMTDVFFEQYEKLIERKERQENNGNIRSTNP